MMPWVFAAGGAFKLGAPEWLWALWLVPLVAVFQIWVFRRKAAMLERFASSEVLQRLLVGLSRPRQVLKVLLVLFGLTMAVLSLSEVKYGFTWEDVKRQGVDVVVALDVSDSMLVEDASTGEGLTRLERARREITDLLQLMDGDRIGLVAFAGAAFVECPLTLDYGAASLFLDDLSTDLIPVKGTAIGQAIRTSLDAFEGGAQDSRAIILITDGEDHSGDALAAAEQAKEMGVRIFAIGIGRDEGSPIPSPRGGFRRDGSGELVLSKLDEPTLQKIALETGGRYVRSVTGDVDLEKIYLQGVKATLEDQELESSRRQHFKDRFQWLLALALLALMVEPFVPERVRGRTHAG
jgi:Ca-activated chloride channel family protein